MFVGLSRVIEPGVDFLAHHDIVAKDVPDVFSARSLRSQLSANIYLQMPSKGGELWLWDKEIDASVFDDMRGLNYGIDHHILGDPDITIKPEVGYLMVFNSRKMHAVTASDDAARITLSCFIGYRGDHQPLTYWS
jgi:hypothetical protein